ncbi:MAG TPA: hypothetical protein ENJ95_14090 [Bacteroidetes bacterium]|nr:hypothetical protein [Bacteroidota bacterium]
MQDAKHQAKGLWGWKIVQAVILLSALYFGQLFLFNEFNEETTRRAIAMSARVAVVFFSAAFMASSLHYFSKNVFTWWLRMNRKYIGVSFAVLHLAHLCFLIVLQYNFHPVFNKAKTISLLGGGLAYVFVVLMLLTSFPYFSKYLSKKQWTTLHTVGGYWIWYIFIRTYVKKLFGRFEYDPVVVWSIIILLALVIVLRIARKIMSP